MVFQIPIFLAGLNVREGAGEKTNGSAQGEVKDDKDLPFDGVDSAASPEPSMSNKIQRQSLTTVPTYTVPVQ